MIAAELVQRGEYRGGLDPLGHDLQLQVVREVDERAHDLRVLRLLEHAFHEREIDLQLVERKLRQVLHGRVARAEVVHRELHPQRLQLT